MVASNHDSDFPPPFHSQRDAVGMRVWFGMADCVRAWRLRDTEAARDRLAQCNAVVKRGGRWETSRALIRRAFPDDFPELLALLDAVTSGESSDDED